MSAEREVPEAERFNADLLPTMPAECGWAERESYMDSSDVLIGRGEAVDPAPSEGRDEDG